MHRHASDDLPPLLSSQWGVIMTSQSRIIQVIESNYSSDSWWNHFQLDTSPPFCFLGTHYVTPADPLLGAFYLLCQWSKLSMLISSLDVTTEHDHGPNPFVTPHFGTFMSDLLLLPDFWIDKLLRDQIYDPHYSCNQWLWGMEEHIPSKFKTSMMSHLDYAYQARKNNFPDFWA